MKLKQKIIQIYENSRKTYGSPRIYQKLLREGYHIGKKRVERLMQEFAIQAVARRKYKATTDSKHTQPVADNHLNRDFTVERPNQAWVLISPTSLPRKAGSIWPPSWISTPARSSVGP